MDMMYFFIPNGDGISQKERPMAMDVLFGLQLMQIPHCLPSLLHNSETSCKSGLKTACAEVDRTSAASKFGLYGVYGSTQTMNEE